MPITSIFFDIGYTLVDETRKWDLPAREAGMFAIFLNRGPWGHINSVWPEVARAHLSLNTLAQLPTELDAVL